MRQCLGSNLSVFVYFEIFRGLHGEETLFPAAPTRLRPKEHCGEKMFLQHCLLVCGSLYTENSLHSRLK